MEKYLLSITEQEIAQLEELYAKMKAARSNYALFWEYDTKFHLQLIGCSKNSILTLFLSTLYRMTQKNIIMNSEDPVSAIEFSQSDHADIIEAVKTKDRERLCRAIERHLAPLHDFYKEEV